MNRNVRVKPQRFSSNSGFKSLVKLKTKLWFEEEEEEETVQVSTLF